MPKPTALSTIPVIIGFVLLLSSAVYAADKNSTESLIDQVQGILIAQAVLGALTLIGFIATQRRFMAVEYPAAIKDIRDDIHLIRTELQETNRQLIAMRRDVDKHENGIESLKEWRREVREGGTSGGVDRDTIPGSR